MQRLFMILIAAVLALDAGAQRVVRAEPVVVTGTRTARPMADVPVPTVVISGRDMELAGASDVTEALRNALPGMIFTPDAMGNNLRMRGLTTRYLLILVDGERLVAEGAGGNVNLDRVTVDDVERIEVVGGAAAALWGAGAVGGVINIITKRGEGVSAAAAAGNNDTWHTGASAAGSVGDWSGRVSASRHVSGSFHGTSPYTDMGGSARLGWASGRMSVAAAGRFFSHETFNPEGVMNTTHRLTHSWTAGVCGGWAWDDNNLKLSLNSDNYLDYNVLERRNDERQRENRASIVNARVLDSHRFGDRMEMVGGVEFDHEEAFAATTLGSRPATRTLHDGALFAQAAWKPRDTEFILGARYTRSSQFGGAFSPSLAAMWRRGRWRLRGGVGMSFRAPSIKELNYDFDHQGMFHIYGNPDLKAENGVYTQLSAEYSFGRVNASATICQNRIDDKITQYEVTSEAGLTELHYKNVSSATLRGVDMNLLWAVATRWMIRGAYSLCDARDNTTRRQLDSTPRHSATASLTWTGWLTAQIGTRVTSPYTCLTTTGSTRRIATQTIWRAAISRKIIWDIAATAKVENIFDRRSVNDPAGRQILIGLKYKF